MFTALKIFAAAAELCFSALLQNSQVNVSLPVLFVASEVTGMAEITSLLHICRILWEAMGFLGWWLLIHGEIRFWGGSYAELLEGLTENSSQISRGSMKENSLNFHFYCISAVLHQGHCVTFPFGSTAKHPQRAAAKKSQHFIPCALTGVQCSCLGAGTIN